MARASRQRCPNNRFPIYRFVSESTAADLLAQVRWRNDVKYSRCRSDCTVRNGSYRVYQRYLCKNCGRTFNDETGTIFAHSKLKLKEWDFTIYTFLRFNTSIRQIEAELDLSYRTLREARRAVCQNARCALDHTVWTGRNRRSVRLRRTEGPRARSRAALAWLVHARTRLVRGRQTISVQTR